MNQSDYCLYLQANEYIEKDMFDHAWKTINHIKSKAVRDSFIGFHDDTINIELAQWHHKIDDDHWVTFDDDPPDWHYPQNGGGEPPRNNKDPKDDHTLFDLIIGLIGFVLFTVCCSALAGEFCWCWLIDLIKDPESFWKPCKCWK